MPKIRCACGARFSFAESSVGKKGKCARCNAVLTLIPDKEESGIIPLAEDPEDGGTSDQHEGRLFFDDQPSASPPPGIPPDVIMDRPTIEEAPIDYGAKLLDTVLFVKNPHNFVVYLLVTGLLSFARFVLPFAGIFGAIGGFVVFGWYCAFRFGTIENAAAGDDKVASVGSTEGAIDAVFLPVSRWIGSWIAVLLPTAVLGLVIGRTALRQIAGNFNAGTGVFDVVRAFLDAGQEVIVVTCALGLFFWPIVAICVAFGGFGSLIRLDLIIKTVLATLPSYVFLVAVVYGTAAFSSALASAMPATTAAEVAAIAASVYLEIVAMRAIGLHYYFFKGRYAWSWG